MAPDHWRSALLLPALLAGLTLGCGGAEVVSDVDPALTTVPAPVTVAAVAPPPTTGASGASFTAPDGRFSAQFPVPPVRAEGSVEEMTFILYSSGTGGQEVSVGFIDYPKGWAALKDDRKLLRQVAQKEGVLSMKDGTFLGHRALDIVERRVEDGVTRYLHERSFLVGNRMYGLRGWSTSAAPTPEHATLMTTFKLTG